MIDVDVRVRVLVARTCVFCGATPVTREHALPNWLNSVFEGPFVSWQDAVRMTGPRRTSSIDQITKSVCRGCNGGWMSALEVQVKSFLTPMILGDPSPISPDEQNALAVWTWKTFLMMERVGGMRIATEAEYHRFHRERSLPDGGHCWIMGWERTGGRNWLTRYWSGELRIANDDQPLPVEVNGYRGTLAIGHVALQVMAEIDPSGPPPRGFRDGGGQDGLIFNISPGFVGPQLPWPPPLVTDQSGLEQFAARHIGRDVIGPVFSIG